jgi:hypothetical protein
MNKKSLVAPILISIFALVAVPVSVSAVTQKSSEINVCVDWTTKEIKHSKLWNKCPARHTAMTMGSEGSSAYEIAVANGFVGTVDDWLTSLEGEDGSSSSGSRGATGATGATGPAGPAGSGGSGGGLYNVAKLYSSGVSSSSAFFTNGWTYYKMGHLVLDPGVYTVSLTLSADKKTFAETNTVYPNDDAYDVCSLFSAEYDPALDWWAQSFPNRAQIFATDTSNADLSFPTQSFFRMDRREGYTDDNGDRVFNNHHSLSTIFSVSDTTKPTAVVVACTLEDDYGISLADANVSGYISATVISGGTVDIEQIVP